MGRQPSRGEDGDRGVSPVIGVILMVAITVILAAVIASFVLGYGDQTNETAPNVNFNGEFDDNQNVTLSIDTTGGDGDASDFVLSNGTDEVGLDTVGLDISAGGSATLNATGGGSSFAGSFSAGTGYDNTSNELQVIFRGDNEQVYDTFELPDDS